MRHLTKLTAALALAGAFATSAIAAPVTYAVDSGHSFPNISYQHMGLSMQLSKFDKTTGTITLDQAAKTASVDVVIDTTSVNTGSTVFNGHIQGEDFFFFFLNFQDWLRNLFNYKIRYIKILG